MKEGYRSHYPSVKEGKLESVASLIGKIRVVLADLYGFVAFMIKISFVIGKILGPSRVFFLCRADDSHLRLCCLFISATTGFIFVTVVFVSFAAGFSCRLRVCLVFAAVIACTAARALSFCRSAAFFASAAKHLLAWILSRFENKVNSFCSQPDSTKKRILTESQQRCPMLLHKTENSRTMLTFWHICAIIELQIGNECIIINKSLHNWRKVKNG